MSPIKWGLAWGHKQPMTFYVILIAVLIIYVCYVSIYIFITSILLLCLNAYTFQTRLNHSDLIQNLILRNTYNNYPMTLKKYRLDSFPSLVFAWDAFFDRQVHHGYVGIWRNSNVWWFLFVCFVLFLVCV